MAKVPPTTSRQTTTEQTDANRSTTQTRVISEPPIRSAPSNQTKAGGKRQIPCPYCNGEVLSEQNGRAARSASLWPKFQNICFAITEVFDVITGNTKTVSRKQAIGGKCEACNNKGSFDDPSDSSDAEQAAANILKANEQKLEENLAKLGSSPGGSRLTRIAGADVLLVGHELNTADSVGIKENVPGPGGGGSVGLDKGGEGRGGLDKGSKDHSQVKQLNTPANSGGGHYVIQCGNKFNLIVGAQGASIDTYGPLNLHGKAGVQITGAEVTIGTGVGQTAIGGKHINLQGDNISLSPTGKSGQITVTGSMIASGNVQSGGAYFDNVYFAKGTCPSKQVPVKGGSTTAIQTGPAIWGGTNTAALKAAFLQLQKHIQERTLDYDLFKAGGPTTPRFFLNLNDLIYGLTYAAIPVELKVTGIAIGTLGVSLVYNFPHTHAMHDGLHNHQVEVPALDYQGYTSATAVRKAANAAGINSQVAAAGSSGDNLFARLWQSVGGPYAVLGGRSTAKSNHSTLVTG
jgi:hypothetical protein